MINLEKALSITVRINNESNLNSACFIGYVDDE